MSHTPDASSLLKKYSFPRENQIQWSFMSCTWKYFCNFQCNYYTVQGVGTISSLPSQKYVGIRNVCSSKSNQRAGYSTGIPVGVMKSISELVVYFLLDGANEVAASDLERSDGIVHRFGLEAQMRQGPISGNSLQEELYSFLLAPTQANYDCLSAFCSGWYCTQRTEGKILVDCHFRGSSEELSINQSPTWTPAAVRTQYKDTQALKWGLSSFRNPSLTPVLTWFRNLPL